MDNICISHICWKNILNDLSCEFEPGHIYGILGPNGSGKTSLLRAILKFNNIDSGSITLCGRNIDDISRRELSRLISLVPQNTSLDTDFSTYDVVMTGRNPHQNIWRTTSSVDKTIVADAMSFTNITHLSDRPFSQLSGGEAQRTCVSRSIAQTTRWIILDEPVASLDIKNQSDIISNLCRLHTQQKVSVIMVLHDINLAYSCCDRIKMLYDGKILYEGTTEETITSARLSKLYGINFRQLEDNVSKYFFPEHNFSINMEKYQKI